MCYPAAETSLVTAGHLGQRQQPISAWPRAVTMHTGPESLGSYTLSFIMSIRRGSSHCQLWFRRQLWVSKEIRHFVETAELRPCWGPITLLLPEASLPALWLRGHHTFPLLGYTLFMLMSSLLGPAPSLGIYLPPECITLQSQGKFLFVCLMLSFLLAHLLSVLSSKAKLS